MSAPRAVVIGAGVSGASAALALARAGQRPVLVEQAPHTLPLIRGFSRQGLHFDTGFHYAGNLTRGGVLAGYFRLLGLADKVAAFAYDEQGYDELRLPGLTISLPSGRERLRQRLVEAFPGEKGAVERYLEVAEAVFRASPFLSPARQGELPPGVNESVSLDRFVRSLTGNAALRTVLSAHCLLYGVSPEDASLVQHCRIAGSYFEGVGGIRGGGAALARAFDDALAEAGVEVRLKSPAEAVELDASGAVCGVRLQGGETLFAPTVVASVHPRLVPDLLPKGALRPVYAANLQNLPETSRGMALYGRAASPRPELVGKNVFFLPGCDAARFFDPAAPLAERPLFLAAGGPESRGDETLTLIGPCESETLAARGPGYGDAKKAAANALAERAAKVLPEADGARWLEAAAPASFARWTGSPTGSLYGAAHTVSASNPLPLTRVRGLTLAGQAVVAPGLLGALISGVLAAGFATGPEAMLKEVRACVAGS